ncbi:MAG: 23S rRNA (uracil(1939)-C(5))-methyltransferase RlmD [Desulfobacteraceae bacterium]|nr:23S rRNA (uracil(1939)-C(5))-methyltransferase RlmD [Desulfobacteraceae bacterium]
MPRRKRGGKGPCDILAEATVESLSHDGRGIARLDGKTIFIDQALPDEIVKFKYTKRRAGFDEGVTVEVTNNPSPDRAEPKCRHFGRCGGCSMQHIKPDVQIKIKEQTLLENLKHFGRVEPGGLLPPLIGPSWGYRRSARLGVRYVEKKGKVLVGFREKNSGFIADMDSCEVLDPGIGGLIPELRELISGLKAFKNIPQIEAAAGDNATALVFRHTTGLIDKDLEALRVFAIRHRLHIYLQSGGPDTVRILWPENAGMLNYGIPDFDVDISFMPGDFIQINKAINLLMVSRAIKMLAPESGDAILDLFCGLGNFTLPISRLAGSVVGIEGNRTMTKRAIDNARINGVNNAGFYAADLSANFDAAALAKEKFDKALIDPPRSGALEAVRILPRLGVNRIVYISCNPATLARDAGELVNDAGFRLVSAAVMDMFPHTTHTEAMAVFERGV